MHTRDCHIWQKSQTVLEEALTDLNMDVTYEVLLVKSQEEAEKYKFGGSPTIQIDGVDVDPMAKNITKYTLSSCRNYVYKNKFFEFPPKEMIVAALGKIQSKK